MNAPDLKLVVDNTPATTAAGVSRFHESARAQVAGAATYIDDIPEVRGTLHAAPVCSPVAHGVLLRLDPSAALAVPGVHAFIGPDDIPGDQMLAAFAPVECHRRRRVQRDRGIRGQPQHAGETLGARRREALQPVAVAAVERRRRLRQPAPDVVEQFVVQP